MMTRTNTGANLGANFQMGAFGTNVSKYGQATKLYQGSASEQVKAGTINFSNDPAVKLDLGSKKPEASATYSNPLASPVGNAAQVANLQTAGLSPAAATAMTKILSNNKSYPPPKSPSFAAKTGEAVRTAFDKKENVTTLAYGPTNPSNNERTQADEILAA